MTHTPPVSLLELLSLLRRSPKADREGMVIEPRTLTGAYLALVGEAPSRTSGYLSPTRTGIPSSKGPSNREEEHLAMALFNAGSLQVAGAATITIADYQMPMKASMRDKGFGKADLVGVDGDGRIAVIELKVAGNREDRRIALVEALVYTAVIEANVARIAVELAVRLDRPVRAKRPSIIVAAPPAFWSDRHGPSLSEMRRLASGVANELDIRVDLLSLEDAALATYGLLGSMPTLGGTAFLGAIAEPRAMVS